MLREGTIVQDRQAHLRQRYPAKGLHWLLGLVRLAHGDSAEARVEFDREIAIGPSQLYAAEFAMNAYDGAGFTALHDGNAPGAVAMFRRALELFPDHARSLVGLGAALAVGRNRQAAADAFARATAAIEALRFGGRAGEGMLAEAFLHSVNGRPDEAIRALRSLLEHVDLPFTGWTIPIEPLFDPLRRLPEFRAVLTALADRAR